MKSNFDGERIRAAVRSAYRENGGNLAGAARSRGVSPSTARGWKRRERGTARDWDLAGGSPTGQKVALRGRAAGRLGGGSRESLVEGLLEEYLDLHKEAVEAVKSRVDDPLRRVDALSRLSQALDRTLRALGRASPELSRLAVAGWVLERLAEFVRERFPDHLAALVELLEPFGAELIREVEKGGYPSPPLGISS